MKLSGVASFVLPVGKGKIYSEFVTGLCGEL